MKSKWIENNLSEIIEFNPKETIPKGTIATKIAMEYIQPFCRDIYQKITASYTGGSKFKNLDTIMARITPCLENGKTAQVRCLKKDEVGFGSTEYIILRSKNNISDPNFIYYLATSPYIRDIAIKSMVGSSGRQRVQLDVLKETKLLVPSYEEQVKIGEILSSLDDKIELNNRINKNLLQQAEAIFQEKFLTCHDLPQGWKMSTLDEVADISAGGDKPKNISNQKSDNFPYPIYSNGISDEGIYGFTSDYKIKEESVTVSARGTIGFVCLRHIPFTPIVRLVTLIPRTDIVSAKYLYLWLKSIHINGTGTTQQQLTVPNFRKTEIIIPPKADMKKFTETVVPLFCQVWSNQEENTELGKLRDTLLPRLMSGELDVSNIKL